MTLLVAGGAAIYFGTLWLLGLRPAELRVQRLADSDRMGDGTGPRSS